MALKYDTPLIEKIKGVAKRLEKSPEETFLAMIHVIHVLAYEFRRQLDEPRQREWDSVLSLMSDQLYQYPDLDHAEISRVNYLSATVLLREILEDLSDQHLGLMAIRNRFDS